MAALAFHLPPGSILKAAIDPDAGWTRQEILTALVANHLLLLRWGMADKKSRGPQPKLVGPSWMTQGKTRKLTARTLSVDELMEILSKPRKARR